MRISDWSSDVCSSDLKEGGLDQILEELKARREWVEAEQERYLKGPWMITLFAHRVGSDVIEVANGLAAQGLRVKVTSGVESQRNAAARSITENHGQGCEIGRAHV